MTKIEKVGICIGAGFHTSLTALIIHTNTAIPNFQT